MNTVSENTESSNAIKPMLGAVQKYSTILADFPWQMKAGRPLKGYKMENGKQLFIPTSNKSRELAYPTLTVEQGCLMPISELTADDAHLYFWTTNQYLMQSMQIIEAWGFKYSTTLVWAKNAMGGGLGGNYKITTEFLIFATKGSLKAKKQHTGTWFNVKREYENGYPCHSRKPTFFHELIESVSPGPYLEIFARRQRSGWDVFGNQVENSIEIPNVFSNCT